MKNVNNKLILLLTTLLIPFLYPQDTGKEFRDDFKKFYDEFGVSGGMVVFDETEGKYYIYNDKIVNTAFSPASTFKIPNSLISVECGAINDESEVIKWDSIPRNFPNWNQDQNLSTAFKYSCVWFYQELARRVGEEKMQDLINKMEYGNRDISGGIDRFWLRGGIKITAMQQIDLLVKLNHSRLPFSARTMDIVKKIMVAKSTGSYIIRAKTGWLDNDLMDQGWYVGYVTKGDRVYYFANFAEAKPGKKDFLKARTEIALNILKELKVITE